MLMALGASAQVVTDPDWKETETPLPPAFNKDRLISIEMPKYVSLRFGVDPATLTITPDGIVRYVVVASNATGSINAMYEGIRCATGEFKTYARYTASGQWSSVQNPQWQGLDDNLPSKHAMALARQGVCEGRSTSASSATAIVHALQNSGHAQSR
ncbi:CNP1-like family protein [Rhodoferax ferrireducens]|uniref:CNP1-like family protein n=1 Tax=Rhodoferax ferrireducens TaxID=192843 RepID=UPI001E3CF222|nr:CNP1-like family protein [Rhodoferax ferrireducens]